MSLPEASDISTSIGITKAFLVAGIGVMICALVIMAMNFPYTGDWVKAGTKGDFWGGHAAFAGAVGGNLLFMAALAFQARELALQREELRQSRQVAEMQAGAAEVHAKTASRSAAFTLVRTICNERINACDSIEVYFEVLYVTKRLVHAGDLDRITKGRFNDDDVESVRLGDARRSALPTRSISNLVQRYAMEQSLAQRFMEGAELDEADVRRLKSLLGNVGW